MKKLVIFIAIFCMGIYICFSQKTIKIYFEKNGCEKIHNLVYDLYVKSGINYTFIEKKSDDFFILKIDSNFLLPQYVDSNTKVEFSDTVILFVLKDRKYYFEIPIDKKYFDMVGINSNLKISISKQPFTPPSCRFIKKIKSYGLISCIKRIGKVQYYCSVTIPYSSSSCTYKIYRRKVKDGSTP